MSLLACWHETCDALRALGDRIAAEPFGTDPAALVEGFEHLVDQTVLWLAWETLHADPARPFFHRHNDLVSQWGGPNADNVYRHARIDPTQRYVVRGRMHGCDEFLLAVRAGFMHQPVWGTLAQFTASEHGIRRGDDFELRFGGDLDAIALPAEAVMLSVREYYVDWTDEEPATFTIECLDPAPAAPPNAEELARRLRASVAEMDDSVTYWNDYLAGHRARRTDNSFAVDSVDVAKGLSVARYEFCFWSLAPDEALIVECEVPEARYWAAQLYMLHTFELVDPYAAISSRNHTQTHVSSDGRVRFVLAGTDPGVANWLDTTGRPEGLCTLRWFWPTGDAGPAPTAAVVSLAELADALPADTPQVTASERAAELAARQSHLRWRFRS